MHELLQAQMCSPFLYKILILIEHLQFLYYSIHPNLDFLFTTVFFQYFQELIQYFQVIFSKNGIFVLLITFNKVHSVLLSGNVTVFLALLYLVFAIEIFMAIWACLIIYKILKSKKKSSTFLTYSLKIFSWFEIFTNTILAFPFFNILVNAVYCRPGDVVHINMQCYSGLYYMHLSCAIIAFIIMLCFCLLFNYLYIDLNPNSQIPFASPQSTINFSKMGAKLGLEFYFAYDYTVKLKLCLK